MGEGLARRREDPPDDGEHREARSRPPVRRRAPRRPPPRRRRQAAIGGRVAAVIASGLYDNDSQEGRAAPCRCPRFARTENGLEPFDAPESEAQRGMTEAAFVRFQRQQDHDGRHGRRARPPTSTSRRASSTLLGTFGRQDDDADDAGGFETPSTRSDPAGGRGHLRRPPTSAGSGMVFQNYALPHMSVAQTSPSRSRCAAWGGPKSRRGSRRRWRWCGWKASASPPGAIVRRPAAARRGGAGAGVRAEGGADGRAAGALDKSLREQLQYEISRIHRELG